MSLESLRHRVDKTKSQYQLAKTQLQNEKDNLHTVEKHLANIEQAQHITQTVAQTVQEQAHGKIARVVTACLKTVFDDMDYGFRIDFDRKRKRTEAKLRLVRDGNDVEDPLEAESGGVIDVAAFALQLASMMLTKPTIRKILILDEPFKFVSRQYRSNINQMIEKLAKDFDVQFIIVTHQEEITCGKQIELS
jgi:DNA repair exonuclease SbcCD ATPase subunit